MTGLMDRVMEKLANMLTPSSYTASQKVASSTGSISSGYFYKVGNVCTLSLYVSKSSQTAAGGNIYTGTITDPALRPKVDVMSATYYDRYCLAFAIKSDGSITVRNVSGSSFGANWVLGIGVTFIVA